MSRHTVVVTDHDFEDLSIEREGLSDIADVIELTGDVGEDAADAHETLADADAVINLRYDLDEAAIGALEDCRVISRYGIGVDNIAVDAASDRGIPVTNVPDYCLEEVSVHALTLYLALARGLKSYDASVADGEWDRSVAAPIHRLSTRTVGVVGYGAIGRAVGERADALGADVVASDPFLSAEDVADDPADLVEFEEVLERADFVTVHSPLTPDTRELFDADAFARMREDAYFVNVARGPIVDTDALYDALEAGEIAGAGLDVFPDEPPAEDDPLRDHPKALTTPHVAWYSEEANDQRRRTVTDIVRSALVGEEPYNVVNE
ncbi:C-terminal binding protein [Halomicroarcula limicola]|uniref:C-terminal binding protein n=1 Tax=Haloarcula limicola TaxID=1429915 RepID=A0A8J7Y8S5_9EURY|nr:C-terminal binding protein [Halomicroarcula limicola]MBV0926182.1 C-terminal binding protein [Halomicroarcula limicola]